MKIRPATIALAIVGMFLLGVALAAPVPVTLELPTRHTDGTAIPTTGAGSLDAVRIEWGTCVNGAFGTKVGESLKTKGTAALPSSVELDLPIGTHATRALVRTTHGVWSDASNVQCKTVAAPKPEAPILVSTSASVYDIVPDYSRLSFVVGRKVGEAPKGQLCDASRPLGEGWFVLESKRNVKLSAREARSPVLAVRCGERA